MRGKPRSPELHLIVCSQIFRARVKRLDLSRRTAIMGVVNVTKDSFYAESCYPDVDAATSRALCLAEAGAAR